MMKRTFFYIIAALLWLPTTLATAQILSGTVLLNGENIPAEYTKLSSNTVALGSGVNASIPQYSEGRVSVPAEVTIGGTTYRVVSVSDMAFRLCNKVTFVELQGNVERIGNFAFKGCTGLKELVMPATLTSIGTGAFLNAPLRRILCASVTPPVWEYNDVFRFREGGIGDTTQPAEFGSGVHLSVPADAYDAYHSALYSDAELGWITPDGWKYFTNVNDDYLTNYRIYTPEDLEQLRVLTDESDDGQIMKRVTLEADIDMTDRDTWTYGIGNWMGQTFTGVFDGQNHTISGLKIINPNPTGYVGLFTSFDGDTIRNLRLKNCLFDGPSDVGSVYGVQFSNLNVVMENIYVDAQVKGEKSVGGLVGSARQKTINIRNCVFAGSVGYHSNLDDPSSLNAGGLIGEVTYGTIKNCAVTGYVAYRYEGYGGPFVGKTHYNYGTAFQVDFSYCASGGFSDYSPNINDYNTRIQLGSHIVISERDGYDFYQYGNVYPHKFGEMRSSNMTNMQTFLMVPNLGLKNWVYKHGEYPLPACFEDLWPVEKNVFTLRPADMPTERVNALTYTDPITEPAFRTYEGLDGTNPSFHYGNFTASRLWFDESINPDVMDRPHILPLGLANITATDGIEYVRQIAAKDVGERNVEEPDYEKDADGRPVLDGDGNPIYTGEMIVLGTEREYSPVGYSVCLPFGMILPDGCRAYQPQSVQTDGETTVMRFRQVQGNAIEAFQPYYVVVEEETVTLSTEAETLCPRASDHVIPLDGYEFVGATHNISNYLAFHENAYILQSDGKWHRVINGSDTQQNQAYIPAFRAYFRSTGSSVKQLSMLFDDDEQPTGITAVQTIDLDGTERYYDLSGRLLPGRPSHGFYIKNGRKYRAD